MTGALRRHQPVSGEGSAVSQGISLGFTSARISSHPYHRHVATDVKVVDGFSLKKMFSQIALFQFCFFFRYIALFSFFEFVTRLLILIEPQQLVKTTSVDKNSRLRFSGTYMIQKAMVNATFQKDFISNTKGQLRASTYLRSLSLGLKTSKQVRSLRCVTYIFLYFTFQTYLLRV